MHIAVQRREGELTEKRRKELLDYKRKYSWHVCGECPDPVWHERGYDSKLDMPFNSGYDESEPEGYVYCSICHHWACPTHSFKGICQKCEEKL